MNCGLGTGEGGLILDWGMVIADLLGIDGVSVMDRPAPLRRAAVTAAVAVIRQSPINHHSPIPQSTINPQSPVHQSAILHA
jgi:hypothetical protein